MYNEKPVFMETNICVAAVTPRRECYEMAGSRSGSFLKHFYWC